MADVACMQGFANLYLNKTFVVYLWRMNSYKFSGHETFICKQLWLKKGYDFLVNGSRFSDDDAVVKLGVGKNMVSSIRHWMKSMNLIDEKDSVTEIADTILANDGFDPFMEDIGTLYLLHYLLVTSNYASIYDILFNDHIKIKTEFTKFGLLNFVKRITQQRDRNTFNERTVLTDISVLIRNYLQPTIDKSISVEDEYSGLFQDIGLIRNYKKQIEGDQKVDYYLIERKERDTLPKEIFLYALLVNNNYGDTVSLNELVAGRNSVGNVFLMNRDGIYNKIEQLLGEFDFLSFSQTAGNSVLQFSKKPNPNKILSYYYEN